MHSLWSTYLLCAAKGSLWHSLCIVREQTLPSPLKINPLISNLLSVAWYGYATLGRPDLFPWQRVYRLTCWSISTCVCVCLQLMHAYRPKASVHLPGVQREREPRRYANSNTMHWCYIIVYPLSVIWFVLVSPTATASTSLGLSCCT